MYDSLDFRKILRLKLAKHAFLGTFCLLFLKFALPDAPYRRVGFTIPKWHTLVLKSGKNPPPGLLM